MLDALRDARGHLYGLPSTFTPFVMYVNLDRLSELGLERPAWLRDPDWVVPSFVLVSLWSDRFRGRW